MVKRKEAQAKEDLNKLLLDNFVNLQKVMTNLAVKFDNLSDNISKLLQLFEISARSFIDKTAPTEVEKDQEFLDKLNTLVDQNKTIAKGLTLMEEKMREKIYGQRPAERQPELSTGIMQQPQPIKRLPRF